jgi:hypothetical protein
MEKTDKISNHGRLMNKKSIENINEIIKIDFVDALYVS